jgi:hypothetical protein
VGSYSYFNYDDITIRDMEGLKRFMAEYKKHDVVIALELDEENETLSFEGMDGWKIISYWYPEFVHMLQMLACFIDGEVHWTFETPDEAAFVRFDDCKLTIHCGDMNYKEFTAEQMIGNREKKREIPEWILQRAAARKI